MPDTHAPDTDLPDSQLIKADHSEIVVLANGGGTAPAVAWPAILGGAAGSLALTVLLFTLGSGFGLASVSPWAHHGASISGFAVGAGIWLIVKQWLASGLGGYLTGRLRTKWVELHTHEVFFRDTANGFVTWAVATVITVSIAVSAAGLAVTGGAAIAGGNTAGKPGGTAQTAPLIDASSADPRTYLLDRLFRTDRPATLAGDADAKAQAGVIIVHGLAQNAVPVADRAYLAQLVTARTGAPPEAAALRVEDAIAGARALETAAQQAADAARKATASLSIFTAIAMLIGAFIACVSAALGGQQRFEFGGHDEKPVEQAG